MRNELFEKISLLLHMIAHLILKFYKYLLLLLKLTLSILLELSKFLNLRLKGGDDV